MEVSQEELQWFRDFLRTPFALDLMGFESMMETLPNPELPKNTCGECSYYKTPRCFHANYNNVITKKDQACREFYPDRHIPRDGLKKGKTVQKRYV
jgi:hypothetical protein